MKKVMNLFLAASILMLSACSFSAGTKKDLNTGLTISYSGFTIKEVVLVGPDNTILNTNEVKLNTQVAIVAQGLENYTLKDGKAYPGLALSVTGKNGEAIINEADLFADSDGYPPVDASALRGTITVGNPMKAGETYQVKMRVWDKIKPESELTAEVELIVKE